MPSRSRSLELTRVCKHCGKQFTPRAWAQEYCNVECFALTHHRHRGHIVFAPGSMGGRGAPSHPVVSPRRSAP